MVWCVGGWRVSVCRGRVSVCRCGVLARRHGVLARLGDSQALCSEVGWNPTLSRNGEVPSGNKSGRLSSALHNNSRGGVGVRQIPAVQTYGQAGNQMPLIRSRRWPKAGWLAGLLALLLPVLFLASCASDSSPGTDEVAAPSTTTESSVQDQVTGDESETGDEVETGDVPVTTTLAPVARIVSLSPTATEVLFAIGAGSQVVAADAYSNFPPEAPRLEGLSGFLPNVESIANLNPDLVVMSFNPAEGQLEALGINVLLQPAVNDLDGIYSQIIEMGEVTGNVQGAQDLVADMRAEVAELRAEVEPGNAELTYFHELDDTLYTVTSDTFIGYLYSLAGLTNIADGGSPDDAYPQFTTEFVLAADPDFIFFADGVCCSQTAQTIANRPGWGALRAVAAGRVIEVNPDVSSRWGPRAVDALRTIIEALG